MFGQRSIFLKRMLARIRKNSQLFWTLLVALCIVTGFMLVAQLFISIAQDAQNRIIDVRIESIQDSISEIALLKEESKDKIDIAIQDLVGRNQTILDLTFYTKQDDIFVASASSKLDRVGSTLQEIPSGAELALQDPKNSYTIETDQSNEHLYQTFRAFTQDGTIIGFIITTQRLSEADTIVTQNIQKGIVVSIIILILIMFLFFKQSRIIDYVTLSLNLKQIDELKDKFISMASDSFKTPLAAIRGYSEFITDASDIKEEYKEYSRRISVSSKHLTFLIEDMLMVLQIDEERIRFENAKILVPDFIKKIMPEILALIEQKNITCTFEQDGLEFAYIMADEIRLKQALIKIIDNAIKYTREGEVKIKLLNTNNQLEIRISDTGIGMDEKECVHLFEKFYRVRNKDTQDIKGTGLGLWIAKQFVEKMGGTISIESTKEKGTCVIMRFEGIV